MYPGINQSRCGKNMTKPMVKCSTFMVGLPDVCECLPSQKGKSIPTFVREGFWGFRDTM